MEIAGSSFATAESAFGPGGLRQLGRRSGTTEQHVSGRSVYRRTCIGLKMKNKYKPKCTNQHTTQYEQLGTSVQSAYDVQ